MLAGSAFSDVQIRSDIGVVYPFVIFSVLSGSGGLVSSRSLFSLRNSGDLPDWVIEQH